jgi:DNA-binding PadR family transcriptional regulator
MKDSLLRDFFLGFVKIHVLNHASREPVYGLALISELGRHGYRLGPGSLYPLLHSLEAAGFLNRENSIVDGRVRKYYVGTKLGAKALDEARVKIRELVKEVLEGGGPEHLPDPSEEPDAEELDIGRRKAKVSANRTKRKRAAVLKKASARPHGSSRSRR